MPDFSITDVDERLFFLNSAELLVAIFRGPDTDGWAAIFSAGLPELVSQVPKSSAELTATLNKLQDSLLVSSEIGEPFSDLQTEYVRLFVAGSGGVIAPLYESCHLGAAPRIMGDAALAMRSRLGECGLEVSLESNEPPDHISLELEYLYHLLASAWSDNRPELEVRARDFARLDMLPWVRRFRDSLGQGTPHPVFLCAADLTIALLGAVGG